MNIAQAFAAAAERYAENTAIIDDGETRSYAELLTSARRAGGLLARRSGRTVGILLPTCKEFVVCYLAALMAGKIPVPINFLLREDEIAFILEDAGIETLLSATPLRTYIPEGKAETIWLDEMSRRTMMAAALFPAGVPDTPDDEVGTILYTSGTSARPKGVLLTHRNLVSNAQASAKRAGFDRPLNFLGVLPLFHSFALTCTALIPLLHGGTVVMQKRFNPRGALERIEKHGIHVVLAVPSMYRLMIKAQQQSPVDASSLIVAIAGGEPLPPDLMDRFEEVFGLPLLEGYGLTETSPVVSLNTNEEHRRGTAGKILPGLEAQIADLSCQEPLPAGREGELWIRGPSVMKGYHRRPEETAATILPDGWLRTGDLAVLDDDGYVSIKGRAKELIIVAGENVSPGEVEDALSSHPDVFEAAVLGEPSPKHGELPVAYVALHEGRELPEKELLAWCRERLAPFKVPRRVEYREELPHGPTGKVLKRAIREG
jgi:long-chain acyl-CoA synthetase